MSVIRRKLCAALVAALAVSPAAHSESLYVVKGGSKSLLFTNKQPVRGTVVKKYLVVPRNSWSYGGCKAASNYESLIAHEARQRGLDPALVKAVVHAESLFNPCARSPKGAVGLMQLMPATARSLGVRNPYEPAQNVRGGVMYLAKLLDRYDGNLALSLAAYNAGPGAVDRHGGIPPYGETRAYVKRVLALRERYSNG